jgi:hypothetical protein
MANSRNLIRDQNLFKIAGTIYRSGNAFASDLGNQLGLSVVTVNSLLKELVAKNIVDEQPLVQRDIGRPATNYSFNYDYEKYLLITIQEEKNHLTIKSHTVNMAGTITETGTTVDFTDCNAQTFINALRDAITLTPDVKALAIAFPGKIYKGVVLSSWNEQFDGWNLDQLITSVTNMPFFIQNDVHMMTIGYCLDNQLPRTNLVVGIYFPQKSMPGISIFTNNELIEGNHALAGEAKFMPSLYDNGAPTNDRETAARLTDLMVSYNIALAPNQFVVGSNGIDNKIFDDAIAQTVALNYHPNRFGVQYMHDFEKCMLLGLRWLILKKTPYAL